MKKYLTLAMFVVLAVALISPVSVSAKTKAGVKSGSFFYFFDKAFEKADLFFTFNPEKKAKKALENADERLAEAEESASENNQEAVSEAIQDYQKNIEVLEKVLNKVPEEAKEAITKAIEADKERREEMTKKIEEINNESVKNDIAELKKEVERLRKEFAELKQKPNISQYAKVAQKAIPQNPQCLVLKGQISVLNNKNTEIRKELEKELIINNGTTCDDKILGDQISCIDDYIKLRQGVAKKHEQQITETDSIIKELQSDYKKYNCDQ